MQMLVVSDSHLQNELLKKITDSFPAMNYYIHCGDSSLNNTDPLLEKYFIVNGNHDKPGTFSQNIIFKAGKYTCLITHGNNFDIYYGNDKLCKYMEDNKIDIAFHGHSHVASHAVINNKHIINPGSIMINRGSYGFGTFALVTISDTLLDVKYYNSRTLVECSDLVLKDGLKMLDEFKKILK